MKKNTDLDAVKYSDFDFGLFFNGLKQKFYSRIRRFRSIKTSEILDRGKSRLNIFPGYIQIF